MAKVLLVDDHPDLSDAVRQILEMSGHEVCVAASAEAAIPQVSQCEILIADQRLPGMTGCDLVRQLRSDGVTSVRMILCSADVSVREPAFAAGADDFWLKGSGDLFALVENINVSQTG